MPGSPVSASTTTAPATTTTPAAVTTTTTAATTTTLEPPPGNNPVCLKRAYFGDPAASPATPTGPSTLSAACW